MLLIKNGFVVDPDTGREGIGDVAVGLDGRICEPDSKREEDYESVINAEGLYVSPGFVDTHAHFRDPGLTYKETLHTGALAAARGGYTSVICMANTEPAIDSVDKLMEVKGRAGREKIRIYQASALTMGRRGEDLVDIEAMAAAGAASFTDDGSPVMDADLLKEAMERASQFGKVISLHEEDPSMVHLAGINDIKAKEMGFRGALPEAESLLIKRDGAMALETGARVCFQHLSAFDSVSLIESFKEKRPELIHAEVTPNHFSLTQDAIDQYGALAKINPPLRTERDRKELIRGLEEGIIDIIATDHAPHAEDEKKRGLEKSPSGIIGLETAFSLATEYLIEQERMPLSTVIKAISLNPARLYGLEGGSLKKGQVGDITIFSLGEETTYGTFVSKSSNSPFLGQTLPGRIRYTIVGGKVVYSA